MRLGSLPEAPIVRAENEAILILGRGPMGARGDDESRATRFQPVADDVQYHRRGRGARAVIDDNEEALRAIEKLIEAWRIQGSFKRLPYKVAGAVVNFLAVRLDYLSTVRQVEADLTVSVR